MHLRLALPPWTISWKSGGLVAAIALLLAFLVFPAAAVDKSQAQKDWKTLAGLTTQFQREFLSQSSLESSRATYLKNWQEWKKQFEQARKDFRTRYGQSPEEVQQAFAEVPQPLDVQQDIRQVVAVADSIDLARQEATIANWAVDYGRQVYNRWKNLTPDPTKVELKLDYAERALSYFTLARELDPKGDYKDFIAQAKDAVEESRPAWEKALKNLKWPGHNSDFEGPGDPDDLAEEALSFLKKHPDWTKPEYDDEHTPIAASVTGKRWEVYKEAPLTGVPTQYSLDFLVAFAGKEDPDIAYCYHMVFYTKEEAGVKKKTPFAYANSRQYAKYKMLMANVHKGSGGGGKPTAAGFGFFWRMILSVTLVLAGMISAAPLIKSKVPQLSGFVDGLATQRGVLGVLALGVGLFCFLRALVFYFAPLTDLVPQAVAVLLGLMLGKELLLRRSAAPAAAEAVPTEPTPSAPGAAPPAAIDQAKLRAAEAAHKAQDILIKNQEKIEALERQQMPLGVLSIAAGVIHLLAGGMWLF